MNIINKILITGACGVTSRTIARSLRKSQRFNNTKLIGTDVCYNLFGLYEGLFDRIYRVPWEHNSLEYKQIMIDICLKEKIDVAIMWGPLGGYYAKQSDVELVVVPIPEYSEGNTRLQGKTYWNISAGVRRGEDDRRQMVEEAIFRNLDKIYAIMDEYGIPHTEPIFVDRLDGYKRHKK